MTCPVCGTRKARRSCPALSKSICPVCCGTKRLKEIACPPDCGYLARAAAHPPAAERRQRQRDFEFAMPMVNKLSEPGYRLILELQDLVRRYSPTALPPLVDSDVAEAARALASTLETAAKGIIFEHQAQSLPAQRLLGEWRARLTELSRTPSSAFDRETATALRRIEEACGRAAAQLDGGPTAYLAFLQRLPELVRPHGAGRCGHARRSRGDRQRGQRVQTHPVVSVVSARAALGLPAVARRRTTRSG